ncbi:MAG: hypothetical protein PUG15_07280 [Bacteroidales bacterium]|nr:hypothetical protein [Bacteroidales bacterium]
MKNLIIIFLFLSFSAFAKKEVVELPIWITDEGREQLAPQNDYFSAFAQAKYYDKNSISQGILQAKGFAKKFLTETIETNVKSSTETDFSENSVGKRLSVSSSYKSNVVSFSEKNLVGMQVDYFVDERQKTVFAFAYLKRSDLFDFYKTKIEKNILSVNRKIETVKKAWNMGEKPQAFGMRTEIGDLLTEIQNDERVLITTDSRRAFEVSGRINQLFKDWDETEVLLNKKMSVYIKTEENVFGRNTEVLMKKLCGELTAENCVIAQSEEDADYVIAVFARTRKADFQSEYKYSYADVSYEVKNPKTDAVCLKDVFSYRSGSTTYEKAGYDALMRSASKISTQIKSELFNF